MKSSILFVTFALLGLLFLPVESALSQDQLTTEELREYASNGVIRTTTATRVKGTPYLNKDWKRGFIQINSRSKSEDVLLRLNTYEQAVEFIRDETIYSIPPANLDGFTLYSDFGNIVFRNGYRSERDNIQPSTLLRVIHDGKTKLLVHHKTVLQKDMASYGMASQMDEYIDSDSYYLVTADETFHEIRLRKRDVLRRLDDHSDELDRYARSNSLDFGEESELARILAHYDTLIEETAAGN